MAAPASANQNAAATMAATNANAGQDDLACARELTSQSAQGARYQPVFSQEWNGEQAQRYMSPFAANVRDNNLRVMDRENQRSLQDVGNAASAAKAFGGDRQAVLEGAMRRDQGIARDNYIDQANQAAYEDAYGRFNADRANRLNVDQFNSSLEQQGVRDQMTAAGLFGQLAGQSGDLASRGVNDLLTTGIVDQSVRQQGDDAAYNEWLRSQNEPLDRFSQLAGILSGVPFNRTETSNTTQRSGGNLFSQLLGAASVAGSIFSDRRLKRNVSKIGELAKGVGVYAYNYLWPSVRQVGVMADEVRKVVPQAVERGQDGFDRVNYSKLLEAVA